MISVVSVCALWCLKIAVGSLTSKLTLMSVMYGLCDVMMSMMMSIMSLMLVMFFQFVMSRKNNVLTVLSNNVRYI